MGCCICKNKFDNNHQFELVEVTINNLVNIYLAYGNSVNITLGNGSTYGLLDLTLSNTLKIQEYLNKHHPDMFYYKKKCVITAVFLSYIGWLIREYPKIDKPFLKQFAIIKPNKNTKPNDLFALGAQYIEWVTLPLCISKLIKYQGFNDIKGIESFGDIAEVINSMVNFDRITDVIVLNEKERIKECEKIKQIICETILI